MLSNTCKYAIRSVIYLSLNGTEGKKIGIKKISEDLEIPTSIFGQNIAKFSQTKIAYFNKRASWWIWYGQKAI